MHELPTTRDIHRIVLERAATAGATRILSVDLEVGALTDLQEVWIERYFAHLSRGTIAEGAQVHIERIPGVFRCGECSGSFEVGSVVGAEPSCPMCDTSEVTVVSGRGFRVKGMEVF